VVAFVLSILLVADPLIIFERRLVSIEKRIDSSTLEVLGHDAPVLEETEVGEVLMKTDKPVVIESFNEVEELGRFVLIKNQDISGGGIIASK
jgi:sulfate adenylyltransferase subunit 1 (EFTu-like GTPase family)